MSDVLIGVDGGAGRADGLRHGLATVLVFEERMLVDSDVHRRLPLLLFAFCVGVSCVAGGLWAIGRWTTVPVGPCV